MKDMFGEDYFHLIALANTFFVYFVLVPLYWIFVK